MRKSVTRVILTTSIIVVSLCMLPGLSSAQQDDGDITVTEANITIDNSGNTTAVSGVYTFENVGSTSNLANGSIWVLPGQSITNISTTTTDETAEATVSRNGESITVAIPVGGQSQGPTTVTIEFEISESERSNRFPLWVPEAGSERNAAIHATVYGVESSESVGNIFPEPTSIDENEINFNTDNIPSMIKVGSENDEVLGISTNNLLSGFGIVLILGLIGIGAVYDARGRNDQ